MSSPRVHYSAAYTPETAFEYSLPIEVAELAPNHSAALTTWTRRLVGVSQPRANLELQDSWRAISSSAAGRLRSHLSSYNVVALVFEHYFAGVRVWLRLAEDSLGQSLLVQEPMCLSEREAAYTERFPDPAIGEFARFFRGAHAYRGVESAYPDFFCLDFTPKPLLMDVDFGEYEGGICAYLVGTADLILVNQSGRVGFWNHGDGQVSRFADTFDGFVDAFIAFLAAPSQRDRKATGLWIS